MYSEILVLKKNFGDLKGYSLGTSIKNLNFPPSKGVSFGPTIYPIILLKQYLTLIRITNKIAIDK